MHGFAGCAYTCMHAPADALVLQTAVRLALPGELGRHATSEGKKAVLKFSGGQGV